jgi:hypothetical protein
MRARKPAIVPKRERAAPSDDYPGGDSAREGKRRTALPLNLLPDLQFVDFPWRLGELVTRVTSVMPFRLVAVPRGG